MIQAEGLLGFVVHYQRKVRVLCDCIIWMRDLSPPKPLLELKLGLAPLSMHTLDS
jgi:hypothetical protein